MDNTEAIKAKDLRKRYGVRTTLDGIEVSVAYGELLGPSGVGKTVTLSIFAGVLNQTQDAYKCVATISFAAPRRRLDLVSQSLGLYPSNGRRR